MVAVPGDPAAYMRVGAEALGRAARVVMSPGDQPAFATWIAALSVPDLSETSPAQSERARRWIGTPATS